MAKMELWEIKMPFTLFRLDKFSVQILQINLQRNQSLLIINRIQTLWNVSHIPNIISSKRRDYFFPIGFANFVF